MFAQPFESRVTACSLQHWDPRGQAEKLTKQREIHTVEPSLRGEEKNESVVCFLLGPRDACTPICSFGGREGTACSRLA